MSEPRRPLPEPWGVRGPRHEELREEIERTGAAWDRCRDPDYLAVMARAAEKGFPKTALTGAGDTNWGYAVFALTKDELPAVLAALEAQEG